MGDPASVLLSDMQELSLVCRRPSRPSWICPNLPFQNHACILDIPNASGLLPPPLVLLKFLPLQDFVWGTPVQGTPFSISPSKPQPSRKSLSLPFL